MPAAVIYAIVSLSFVAARPVTITCAAFNEADFPKHELRSGWPLTIYQDMLLDVLVCE